MGGRPVVFVVMSSEETISRKVADFFEGIVNLLFESSLVT